jgi:hypothetical protein
MYALPRNGHTITAIVRTLILSPLFFTLRTHHRIHRSPKLGSPKHRTHLVALLPALAVELLPQRLVGRAHRVQFGAQCVKTGLGQLGCGWWVGVKVVMDQ